MSIRKFWDLKIICLKTNFLTVYSKSDHKKVFTCFENSITIKQKKKNKKKTFFLKFILLVFIFVFVSKLKSNTEKHTHKQIITN